MTSTRRPRTVAIAAAESGILKQCVATILDAASPADLRAAYAVRRPKKRERNVMIAALAALRYTHASVRGTRATPVTL